MLLMAARIPVSAQPGTPIALTLEQAYERALATDQSIGIAAQGVRKAELLPWSSASRLGPRLTANASYEHPERELSGDNGPIRSETTRADITLQQPLFDPQIFAALRASKLSVEASKLAHRSTVRTVLFGVSRAYFEVLKQQRVNEVNRETLELAREQLALAERRYNVGVAVKTDMLRARVQVEQANRAVTESANALLYAQAVLANVLNISNAVVQVTEPPATKPGAESYDALLNRAFERREDLQAGQIEIRRSQELHSVVRADWGPRVTGRFSYQWIDPETQSQKSDFWDAGIAVQLPIFNGGQRSVDLKRSALEIVEAQLQQENLSKVVEQDVKAAWLLVQALEKTLVAIRAQVAAAEENYKDLQSQYRAGAATSLDVMSALNDLNTARRDLATQTYDFEVAALNLERATGTFQDQRVEKLRKP